MVEPAACLLSLAVEFPKVRVNDYWHIHHPDVIAGLNDKILAAIWKKHPGTAARDPWDEEMQRFVDDPFRGAQRRCVLGEDRSILDMELVAAQRALQAAGCGIEDVDLMLATAFLSDHPGIGNSAFLARELGYEGAAWNIESACNSAVVCLETAEAFIKAGKAHTVLVVVSCTYSRVARPTHTMSLSTGDGCVAYVVSAADGPAGVLSAVNQHTGPSCGAVMFRAAGPDEMAFQVGKAAGAQLRDAARDAVEACSALALERAGVAMDEVDFFIFPCPTAWHVPFYERVLGVPDDKTIDLFPQFANTGPVLSFTNLYYAAREGRVKPGDLVLLHAIGSSSSAGSTVMRWGEVALGEPPALAMEDPRTGRVEATTAGSTGP